MGTTDRRIGHTNGSSRGSAKYQALGAKGDPESNRASLQNNQYPKLPGLVSRWGWRRGRRHA